MVEESRGSQVLVVYGVPATMPLVDVAGHPLPKVFELTGSNRASSEVALRRALISFMGGDALVTAAHFEFIRNAADLDAAVRSGKYTQVVYYGHALQGVNALLPTARNRIVARQIVPALSAGHVSHFDILGCQSSALAAELATLLPRVRIGHLRAKRLDDIQCDPNTLRVVKLSIESQPILHFESR